jgi:hypothetical protein
VTPAPALPFVPTDEVPAVPEVLVVLPLALVPAALPLMSEAAAPVLLPLVDGVDVVAAVPDVPAALVLVSSCMRDELQAASDSDSAKILPSKTP